jgi:molybdenum cofactor biosynthesis enzyme MoaA
MGYDYANILFTGNCNLNCFGCIGKHPSLQNLPINTSEFPLKNIDLLLEKVNQHKIPDLAFTGTNIDPQLYKHELKLINFIRERLNPETRLSLHTNGLLVLTKLDVFNSYDKASISFPSFNQKTFFQVTKSKIQPSIEKILSSAKIPVKLSMLVTPFNEHEIPEYLQNAKNIGIKRIVLRKLKNHDADYPIENIFKNEKKTKEIFGWPVYDVSGLEVTICGFDNSTARGLFLFSNGRLENYLVK